MVQYKTDPVISNYPDGKAFCRLLDDGSGFAHYPSGRIAVAVTTTPKGFVQQCFADDRLSSILVHFNEVGEGSVLYPPKQPGAGRPHFVCTIRDGKLCCEKGNVQREWAWEAPTGSSREPDIPDPWQFKLNQYMTFTGTSRQDLKVKLSSGNQNITFDVGEMRKRKDTYLERHFLGRVKFGPSRGAAILDIGAKTETYRHGHAAERSEIAKNASLGASAGAGGLEGADATAGSEAFGATGEVAALASTMGSGMSLNDLETSIGKMQTWQDSARTGKHSVLPFVESDVLDELRAADFPNPLKDVGGPQPATVRQFHEGVVLGAGDYHHSTKDDVAFCLNSGRYHAPYHSRPTKKRKLRLLKTKTYDKFLNSVVPKQQLVCVAVLQDSDKVSRRLESTLQDAWGEIVRAGNATKPGARRAAAEGEGTHTASAASSFDRLPYRLVKFELTESRLLINRHNFHSAPMFLMYYGGKLVFANSMLAGKGLTHEDLMEELASSLKNAQKGVFLPDDFQFGIGAGEVQESGGLHSALQERVGVMAKMLDEGRDRRLGRRTRKT